MFVTAKSYIAWIGTNTGTVSGQYPVWDPINECYRTVQRQSLLNALAAATDVAFNEKPSHAAQNKEYRLFSQAKLVVTYEGRTIERMTLDMRTDVGMEGFLQPPPLAVSKIDPGGHGGPTLNFSWFGKGRPHLAAEPTFQAVKLRTSNYIWHAVSGTVDVSSGKVQVKATVRGSRFPSHRIFVNNVRQPQEQAQGPFTCLWDADASDPTMVR